MDRFNQINNLSGLSDTKGFFQKNNLKNLSRGELQALNLKLADLNASMQLDAFLALVTTEISERSGHKWHIVNTALAILAIVISVIK